MLTRRTFISGAAAALASVAPASPQQSGERFAAIRRRLQKAVSSEEATGIGIAVTRGGRILWEEGIGWADEARRRQVTSRTPFCLASVTKPFTTTLLATLAAEGKISLDDSIGRYPVKLPQWGSEYDLSAATLRRLGSHAGGFPTIFEMFFPHDAAAPSSEKVLQDYGRLAFPPGEIYEYSNVGYALLGALAEHVTGQDFASLMTERVLRPLGMRDSFFGTDKARLQSRALPYAEADDVVPYYTTATPPSGELYVSAHDIARFAAFNLGNPLRGAAAILGEGWIAELHRPAYLGPAGSATTFGWFRGRTTAGLDVLFKRGGQVGVATSLYMVPPHDVSCAVLTNRSDDPKFVHEIVDAVLGTLVPGWSMPPTTPEPAPAPFAARPEYAGRWEGRVANDGVNVRAILEVASNSTCTLSLGGNGAEAVTDLRLQGNVLTGNTHGKIDAADAIRTQATDLELKLMPWEGKLVGRISATARQPGTLLPFVLALTRGRA